MASVAEMSYIQGGAGRDPTLDNLGITSINLVNYNVTPKLFLF